MEEHDRETKPVKTPEELAQIDYLDKLRTCEDEPMPTGLPLACVVKVVGYEDIPKANDQYALATIEGRGKRTWRLCINRNYLEKGERALFVSGDAVLPMDDERFINADACKLHERVYKFGFGVKVRRRIPFVKRNIYRNNCGVLYPIADFRELQKAKIGDVCAALLHIESAEELQRHATDPQPKKAAPVKSDFLAKLRLHRKRFGW